MAPLQHRGGGSAHNSLTPSVTNGESVDTERDIWSSILQQVQKTATNKLPANKSILVLGNNDSGKSSLIAKMQGSDTTCKGSGLEYHYLMVRDEYRDEQTQCGVWILDGNYQWKSNLLKFSLNADNFADTTVLLVCSMTKPWEILDSLHYWTSVLETHIKSLNLDSKVLEQYREQNRRRFQDYISPGDEIESLNSLRNRTQSGSELSNGISQQVERDPLPDDVLSENLGLDIVVAITKTDYMSVLEKEYDYKEEHFDFIQQAIRKFCLRYGASLMYVSAKINKNCDLLYKYLVHRIYGLKFKTPALVVEKDAVFIPSGWDNEKKIAILYENIQSFSPDDQYNEVIVNNQQFVNPTAKEQEIVAEDDQIFLIKLRTQLNQQVPNSSTPRTSTGGNPSPVVTKAKTPGSAAGSPASTLLESSKNNPGGEGVLQTFFNSLLNRKSAGGASGPNSAANSPRTPSSASGATAAAEQLRARDVHAELDRIIEGNKTPLNTSNNNNQ